MRIVRKVTLSLFAVAVFILFGLMVFNHYGNKETSSLTRGKMVVLPPEMVLQKVIMADEITESDWKSVLDLLSDLHNESAFGILLALMAQQRPFSLPFEYVMTNYLKPSFSHNRLQMTIRSEIALLAGSRSQFNEMTNIFARQTERLSRANAQVLYLYYADYNIAHKIHSNNTAFVNIRDKKLQPSEYEMYHEIINYNNALISNEMAICVFGETMKPAFHWHFTNSILEAIFFQ